MDGSTHGRTRGDRLRRRRTASWLLVVLATALAAVPLAMAARPGEKLAPVPAAKRAPAAAANMVDGRYIVVYERSVPSADAETDRQERANGFRAKFRYRRAVKGFAAKLSDAQVRRLRADPDVAFVVPDRTVRASGAVPLASGDRAPTGVRRMHAATATTAREASDSAVAVIDTGVDLSHRDLNAADGKNCVTPGAPAQDENGHGTHVAGTVGARNDGTGVVGVAPGTKVYAVKVLDAAGSGTFSQIICGLDWVTANSSALKIKVANMSLGGPGTNDNNCGNTVADPLHQAVCRSTQAGVSVVAAAGNSRWDLGDSPPDVPAVYPEVLTVTAMSDSDGKGGGTGPAPGCRTGESDDSFATFSNYATRPADAAHMVAAPGVCIRSTWPGGGYSTISGTSMASPHVAGAVALCLGEGEARGPCAGKTPAQIIDHVRGDAQAHATADATYGFAGDPLRANQWGDYFGHLARTAQDTTPPDTRITAGPTGATRSTTADLAFASTEPGSTFECRLDDGPWQACTSPRSLSSLADGSRTFAVRATDAAGNADASAATRTWTVDTQAPDTSITSGPAGLTDDSTPTFALAATEPDARFECRVDAGPWASCSSPHTTQALVDGDHAIEVRATDAAGNVDQTPASRSVTVDATAPDSSITSGPEGVTKNTTPTFEFSASEAGARLDCRVDAEPWARCSSPHRTAPLADGDHTFEVRAGDAAGNVDPTPARRSFTVDPAAAALLPPRATSGDATGVGATAATVAGVVNPNGQAATYHFEYGTTTAYGSRTGDQGAGEGTDDRSVAATLSGLRPATTYHYRVVATNAAGTRTGEDRSFTTAAAPAPPAPSPQAPVPPAPAAPAPGTLPASPAPAPVSPAAAAPANPADATAPSLTVTLARQKLATVLRKGLRVSLACSEACTVSASLVLDGRAAKRLGLSRGKPVTVGRGSTPSAAAGRGTVVVRLTSAVRRRLARLRSVRVALRTTVRDGAANSAIETRRITLRR